MHRNRVLRSPSRRQEEDAEEVTQTNESESTSIWMQSWLWRLIVHYVRHRTLLTAHSSALESRQMMGLQNMCADLNG